MYPAGTTYPWHDVPLLLRLHLLPVDHGFAALVFAPKRVCPRPLNPPQLSPAFGTRPRLFRPPPAPRGSTQVGTLSPGGQQPTSQLRAGEVGYMHGAERLSMQFHLQMKVYSEGKPGKATKGKRLDAVTCRYDAAKNDERWTFAEARGP